MRLTCYAVEIGTHEGQLCTVIKSEKNRKEEEGQAIREIMSTTGMGPMDAITEHNRQCLEKPRPTFPQAPFTFSAGETMQRITALGISVTDFFAKGYLAVKLYVSGPKDEYAWLVGKEVEIAEE